MNISFENPDKVSGLLTLVVEEADIKKDVNKTIEDYRKKANIPGFRPGKAPLSLIKRQFGMSIKMDAINKLVGEQLQKYIKDNDIQMLGEPMASESQEPQDLEKDGPYTFKFDIAIAPEFKCELTGRDKVDYYQLKVDDELIDRQVDMFASQAGSYAPGDHYEENDTLKGELRELDEAGNTKEGGIVVEDAIIMPSYIKVEDQKNLFDGVKPGDVVTFSPRKAYPENDAEVSRQLLASFARMMTEYKVDTALRFGNPGPEIIGFAKEGGFDAILMTRSSRGCTQKMGSVSTYIVRNASFIDITVLKGI